jgi:hypothetical protein
MTVILKAVPLGPSGRQRQHGIESIQRLDRGLFIHAKHRRMLRRVQVEADNIRCFALEVRIVAGQIVLQTVWLQARLGQNPLHGRLAHAQLAGQFPAGPVGAAVVRFLLYSPHHTRLHRGRRRSRPAAFVTRVESGQSPAFEALVPTCDGRCAGLHALLNFAIALAFGESQDQARAEHVTGGQGSGLGPTFQFLFFVCGQDEQASSPSCSIDDRELLSLSVGHYTNEASPQTDEHVTKSQCNDGSGCVH